MMVILFMMLKVKKKKKLTVNDLLKKFEEAIGEEFVNDRMLFRLE